MMNVRIAMGVVIVLMFGSGSSSLSGPPELAAQASQTENKRTVWAGVYQDAQAMRGEALYQEFCMGCHGSRLTDSRANPPLAGDVFMESWREDFVESLFLKIRDTMPRRNASKVLTNDEAIDLVAFIFSKNGFPAGAELRADTVGAIRIELKEGPKPLPPRSQLQVVGCLSQDGSNWVITNAG